MLLKTIVPKDTEGAVCISTYDVKTEEGKLRSVSLYAVEKEYSEEQVAELEPFVATHYLHTTRIFDYESSSDAGPGTEDYSCEEKDEDIALSDCVIENGKVAGILCSYSGYGSLLVVSIGKVEVTKTSYSGRGYHHYDFKRFELQQK